jgi:hypothetical protein
MVQGKARVAASEWSERDERHGRLHRKGSGRAQRELPRYNGASGRRRHRWENREIEWSFWESDIEGKTTREAASELGKERVSNGREHMSQYGQRASFNSSRRRERCPCKRATWCSGGCVSRVVAAGPD